LTEKGQILKSATVIGFVTLISRVFGYLRDQRVTLLLGTSPAADAFVLAFRVPNLIRRMTGEGALGASFIPVFAGYLREKPRREALEFAQRMFWVTGAILAVVAVLGSVFSKQAVDILTLFGGGQAHWELAIFLNRIIFPCVLFVGLAALAAAILNTFHVFGLPASTSILFNLVLIGFSYEVVYRPILRWTPEAYRSPAVALAVGVLVGAAVQLAVQIPALARRGMRFWPDISFRDPGVRKIGRLVAPAFFGMAVYQINFFVDTIFATSPRMPAGSVTSLYVADRVMELVLGSYAIAMSTALLPLARQFAPFDWILHGRIFHCTTATDPAPQISRTICTSSVSARTPRPASSVASEPSSCTSSKATRHRPGRLENRSCSRFTAPLSRALKSTRTRSRLGASTPDCAADCAAACSSSRASATITRVPASSTAIRPFTSSGVAAFNIPSSF